MAVLSFPTFTLRATAAVTRGGTANPDFRIVPAGPRTAIALQINNVIPVGSQEIPIAWAAAFLITNGAGAADLSVAAQQIPVMQGRRIVMTRAGLLLGGLDGNGANALDWGVLVWLTRYARTAGLQWWDR